jgi:hypothetical protein
MKPDILYFKLGGNPQGLKQTKTMKCDCGCGESIQRHIDLTRPVKSHTERMKEYNRRYREKNSDQMVCPCGSTIKKISNYTHLNSKKHNDWKQVQSSLIPD